MTRAISGLTVVDDLDRGIIVFVDGSRLSLSVPQLVKNELQIFGDFCGGIGCYVLEGEIYWCNCCSKSIY